MLKYNVCLLILLSTGLFSCQQSFPDKLFYNENYPGLLRYRFEKHISKTPINAALFAQKETNNLILEMQILNTFEFPVKINLNTLQIKSPEGIRSYPIIINNSPKETLGSGEFYHYQVSFNPINSLELYKKIGFNGDLKTRYSVELNFIRDFENNIVFNDELKFNVFNNDWEEYLNNFAKDDKIEIFKLDLDKNKFVKKQKSYLNKHLNHSKSNQNDNHTKNNSININDQEILINGIAVKIGIYNIEKQLYTNIQLVNHSVYTILIDPNLIHIEKIPTKNNNGRLKYEVFKGKMIHDTTPFKLLKGKRYNYGFNFQSEKFIDDTIYLNLKGIVFKKNNKPILDGRLKFGK